MNLTILCCVGCVLYVAGHHIRDPSSESISFVWLYGWRHNRYIGRFRIYIVGCHAGQRAVSTICKSYRYVAIRLDGVGAHGDDLVQLIVLGGVFAHADRSGSRGQLGSPQLLAGLGGVPDLRSHTGNRDLFPGQGVLHVVSHGHLVLPGGILAEGAARAGVEDHTHKAIRGLMAVVRIILVLGMEGLIRVLGRYLNDLRQRAINGIYCPCLINRRRRHKLIDRRSGIHLFPARHIGQIGGGSKALHLLFCRQALC